MNSPEQTRKELITGSMSKDPHRASLAEYQVDADVRRSLRNSIASTKGVTK